MKKLFIFLSSIIIVSCSNTSSEIKNISTEVKLTDAKYEVLKEEKSAAAMTAEETIKLNEEKKYNRCKLQIKINEKLNEDVLKDIAIKLRADRAGFDKLYISFYLPERLPDASGNGAWAIANFTPELEVEIIGSTNDQDKLTGSTNDIEGKIIGKWRSEKSLMGASLILYTNKQGQLIMKTTYKDGQTTSDEIKEKTKNSKKIFDDGNSHGEYYIIESNGNLGLYGKNGKFDEAEKIN
jgi:hypothetical protein